MSKDINAKVKKIVADHRVEGEGNRRGKFY